MHLLGSIVKQGIHLNGLITNLIDQNETEQQKNQLKQLIKQAQPTAFGKYYGFSKILESENIVKTFQDSVPMHTYKSIHEMWWSRQIEYPDITWPGKPSFYALSSGTTGKKSKRIPVSEAFQNSMRAVGKEVIRNLPNFDLPESMYESEVLLLSSSAQLKQHDSGHLEGEISGINIYNFPDWYDLFYRPGKEIAIIDNWDDRLEAIVKEAPEWNIGAIAGIPSWVLLMLKAIIDTHDLDSIHDIWPNFSLYASGGVTFETYRDDFDSICENPIQILDTYLASEGFFAYGTHPESMSMRLAVNHGYFYEFIPFDERGVDETGQILENPEVHLLDEVVENQDYVLVVSTCAGAWRYMIGDTIKFTNLNPPEILLTGRTKFYLNVVGSQLSENKLDEAILSVSEALGVSVNEYIVGVLKDNQSKYYHQWIIVSNDKIDNEKFREKLDKELQQRNKNYKVARNKALDRIELKHISKKDYYEYMGDKKKKGGQMKTPKVMNSDELSDMLQSV